MKTMGIKLWGLLMLALVAVSQTFAQTVYKADPTKSKLIIEGTSSLHDWTMEASDFNCVVEFKLDSDKVDDIAGINFSVEVKNLTSNEGNLMDRKAHDALKEGKSPVISFKQQSVESLSSSNGRVNGRINGQLTIAGKTKQLSVPFSGRIENNRLIVTGTLDIKMSDFDIEPPTAMLGVLKTGNDVTLNYSFEFQPQLTSEN